MFRSSETSLNITEQREESGHYLLFKCSFDEKYKDSCVLFTVQKQNSRFLTYIVVFVFISVISCVTSISKFYIFLFTVVFCSTFFSMLSSSVRKETAYLLVPVGLQLNTVFLLGHKSNIFIPWSSIQNFLIVEVVTRQTVIYCLIVLVKNFDHTNYVTLFENTKPRLAVLEKVYRKFQTILKNHRQHTNLE